MRYMASLRVSFENYVQSIVTDGYKIQDIPRYGKCIVPINPAKYRLRRERVENQLEIINDYLEIRKGNHSDILDFTSRYGLIDSVNKPWEVASSMGLNDDFLPACSIHKISLLDKLDNLVSSNNKRGANIAIAEAFSREGRMVHRSGGMRFGEDYSTEGGIVFHSSSLYEYLLVFAADQIIRGGIFLACEQCFKLHLIKATRGQKAKYCSGACRVAAHRERAT